MLRTVKDLFLCLLSALLLVFSFPNFNIWLFAWFGFIPLFFSLKNKSITKSFFFSFFTGVVFWSGIIYWLIHVTLPGTIVLILYLALYFGVFGAVISFYTLEPRPRTLIFIPSIWVLLEYIRGILFTGFPWALLGYSQYLNLPIIQIADITGAWGVSFLVMMANIAIYLFLIDRSDWVAKKLIFIPGLCICAVLIYGIPKAFPPLDSSNQKQLIVSVVQGNIPQTLKWDAQYAGFILDRYNELTKKAALDMPDLIIWPEAAAPGILGEDNWVFENIFSLAKEVKIPLLTGAVVEDNQLYFGSALLINNEGRVVARYDKLHLVPFGEYIPLKKVFPFLQTVVPIGDIEKGKDYTIFQLKAKNSELQAKFAVLDCFEDVFPELAREFTKKGAQFLVNITNDAWYKETSAPFQHLQASVFRALENRIYLARAANTGVSGFISPEGRIISLVAGKGKNIFVRGFDTQEIKFRRRDLSFYTKYGDIFVAACFLFALFWLIRAIKIKKIKNLKK